MALEQAQQVAEVQRAWQEPVPRLLIFDNLDKDCTPLLRQWRPTSGGCRVLVTSRSGVWESSMGVAAIPLDLLDGPRSRELRQALAPRLQPNEADAVAAATAYLPLALHLAGSFLHQKAKRPVDSFIKRLEAHKLAHRALAGKAARSSPTDHELTLAGTFSTSWEQLDPEKDKLAVWQLLHASLLAPNAPIGPTQKMLTARILKMI